MTTQQRDRLQAVKENLRLLQNACNRVQADVERAEAEGDDEKTELLITLAEKELAGIIG